MRNISSISWRIINNDIIGNVTSVDCYCTAAFSSRIINKNRAINQVSHITATQVYCASSFISMVIVKFTVFYGYSFFIPGINSTTFAGAVIDKCGIRDICILIAAFKINCTTVCIIIFTKSSIVNKITWINIQFTYSVLTVNCSPINISAFSKTIGEIGII